MWDGVPLCAAHMGQVAAGRRLPPCTCGGVVVEMATHMSRAVTMGDLDRDWSVNLADFGFPGWSRVTKVERFTPLDGVPRIRLHFLTEAGQRPQHVMPAADPPYPFRRPTALGVVA